MFRPMRRTKRAISDEDAKRLLEQHRVSAAVFGARLGSARDNWTEQLTNTAGQACLLAASPLA